MDLPSLRDFIVNHYNREELQTLCFDLGVNYDALPGEGTAAKARELILYLGREKELEHLLDALRPSPGVEWDADVLYAALPAFKAAGPRLDQPRFQPVAILGLTVLVIILVGLGAGILTFFWDRIGPDNSIPIPVVLGQTASYETAQAEAATQVALANAKRTTTAQAATTTTSWLRQDDDRDGLINSREIGLNTLTNNRDTDGDDLSDGDEINQWYTDPLDSDSDDDGLKDGEEVSRGIDPLHKDTDQDGTPDASDTDPGHRPTLTSTATPTPTPTPMDTPTPTPTSTDTATPAPTLGIGSTMARERDDAIMVYVPGGSFQMGSLGGQPDERPVHLVTLDSFWIDKYQVTNSQFRNCVTAGVCRAPTTCDWDQPTYQIASYANHPVVCVDWYDATTYCDWVGGRLPTEAEWAYAARGPDGNVYPWGNTFDCSRGNFDDETQLNERHVTGGPGCDGYDKTAPVGSYPAGASWCEALDMEGNVWEWTSTLYQSYPYRPDDGREDLSAEGNRVLRGSAWHDPEHFVRSAKRDQWQPNGQNPNYGFRCALSATP